MQIDPNSVQWDDAPVQTPTSAYPGVIRGAPSASKAASEARAQSAEGRAVEDQAMQRAKFEQDQERLRIEREKLKTENIKATEGQSKAAGFLTRALRANKVYEDQGVGARSLIGQSMAANVPGVLNTLPSAIGNSPERQVSDATQDDFIAACPSVCEIALRCPVCDGVNVTGCFLLRASMACVNAARSSGDTTPPAASAAAFSSATPPPLWNAFCTADAMALSCSVE